MAEDRTRTKFAIKRFAFKALKATAKAAILYAIYYFLWSMMSHLGQFVPDLQIMAETFIIVYITLMIIGELTAGTIYHYFFGAAKSLFVILYLILASQGGMIAVTYESVNLLIDVRILVGVAMLLGLIGLAKSILQALNHMSEKAEPIPCRL